MLRFFLRRLLLIPVALLLVNFLGFSFAHITYQMQNSQTIFGSGEEDRAPIGPAYLSYARGFPHFDFGKMPVGVNNSILGEVAKASLVSFGLLALAFVLSLVLGLALGLSSVKTDPPQTAPWLSALVTVGLAMPSFYIGTLLVSVLLLSAIRAEADPILPLTGFGWDAHLILPVLALTIRPTMQIAQMTGTLLSGELGKRYIVAARSFGHTWHVIRWDKALRNVLAPILLTVAGSFRLLMTELILVEWLFNWPGLGYLLVQTLVPPRISNLGGMADTSIFFLNPPLVAALLMVFALLFLLTDTFASGLARAVDPRLRIVEEEVFNG